MSVIEIIVLALKLVYEIFTTWKDYKTKSDAEGAAYELNKKKFLELVSSTVQKMRDGLKEDNTQELEDILDHEVKK